MIESYYRALRDLAGFLHGFLLTFRRRIFEREKEKRICKRDRIRRRPFLLS